MIPKNKKFNKIFKLRLKNQKIINHRTITLKSGEIGIKATVPGFMKLNHFKSLQLIIRKTLKKKGKFWFRKLPYTFFTKKPSEVRMGKGKGSHSDWVCPIKAGQIILEFSFKNFSSVQILKLLRKCKKRLPIAVKYTSLKYRYFKFNADNNFNYLINNKKI